MSGNIPVNILEIISFDRPKEFFCEYFLEYSLTCTLTYEIIWSEFDDESLTKKINRHCEYYLISIQSVNCGPSGCVKTIG